jgi:hypothetical protein
MDEIITVGKLDNEDVVVVTKSETTTTTYKISEINQTIEAINMEIKDKEDNLVECYRRLNYQKSLLDKITNYKES